MSDGRPDLLVGKGIVGVLHHAAIIYLLVSQ
jgi:hypothetical protein